MKQLNWQETVRIFTEAAKLSTEDQGFFIQTQCGDDFELHRSFEVKNISLFSESQAICFRQNFSCS
jgi:hypothetical protein